MLIDEGNTDQVCRGCGGGIKVSRGTCMSPGSGHSESSIPETTVGRFGVCHFHSCCFSFFRLLLFGQFLCCAQSILLALCPGITSGGAQGGLSAAGDRIRAERMKGKYCISIPFFFLNFILLLGHTCWCSRLCSLGSLLVRLEGARD